MFLIVLPQSLIKFLPFSCGRTHDLFDRWNHVKLCVDFLYFRNFSSFSFSSYCLLILYCFTTISIKAYKLLSQHLLHLHAQKSAMLYAMRCMLNLLADKVACAEPPIGMESGEKLKKHWVLFEQK